MTSSSKDTEFAPINLDASDRIPAGAKKPSPSPKAPQTSGGVSKGLFSVVLIAALGAAGASIYLFTQLQSSKQIIVENQNRLDLLENRLSATGEEMDNSTVALQVKVTELSERTEELWEQMDRLWASAWRRNQAEIKELNSQLVSLKRETTQMLGSIESKVNSSQSGTQQLMTRINDLNGKITEQANNLLGVKVENEGIGATNAAQSEELRQLMEKVLLLEKRNTSLLQKLNGIETQVKELAVKTV
jgi:chromosome segregation ATPase